MHRNDADGFAPGGFYQEGSPGAGLLASVVGAKQLNTLQEELIAIVQAAGLTPDDQDNGQLLEALTLIFSSGNAAAVLKNRLVNGGFNLWQRGASIAVANVNTFTADRWVANADATGTGTATISRQNFALGQTAVPGNPAHFLRYLVTAAATAGPILFQPIEDVTRYSSGFVTVSFWAKATTTLNAASRVIQAFGSGGSAPVTVGVLPLALTTSWQRFSATYALPSVTGKTIGPSSYLRVGFSFPAASTYTIDIAEVQIEVGQTATAFDRRPPQFEYLLAARYFEKSYALEVVPGTLTRAGALHRRGFTTTSYPISSFTLQERFRVPKRVPPTMLWYAPLGSAGLPPGAGKFVLNNGVSGGDNFLAVTASSTSGTSQESTGYPVREISTETTFFGSARGLIAHWTASAELL